MKNKEVILLLVVLLTSTGCSITESASKESSFIEDTPGLYCDMSIMHDDSLYYETSSIAYREPHEEEIIGTSIPIDWPSVPKNEGELNFPCGETQYAAFGPHVIVLIDNEWRIFTKTGNFTSYTDYVYDEH